MSEEFLASTVNSRSKISIYIPTSIHGYIARKNGSLDWLDRISGFGEDYGFQKLLQRIDALIIGRKTTTRLFSEIIELNNFGLISNEW